MSDSGTVSRPFWGGTLNGRFVEVLADTIMRNMGSLHEALDPEKVVKTYFDGHQH